MCTGLRPGEFGGFENLEKVMILDISKTLHL
jgi:hypothetical protein